jgi:hypothetical protein
MREKESGEAIVQGALAQISWYPHNILHVKKGEDGPDELPAGAFVPQAVGQLGSYSRARLGKIVATVSQPLAREYVRGFVEVSHYLKDWSGQEGKIKSILSG